MIHHQVAQGSGEWLRLRLGIPTASQFHRIFIPEPHRLPAMTEEQNRAYKRLRRKLDRDGALAEVFGGKIPEVSHFSLQSRAYAFRLAAEVLLNELSESLEGQEWMERGKDLEASAVRMYEFCQEAETVRCGFLTTDDGRVGATPDRLIVGRPAALEIKCPAPWTHLEYMIDGFGTDYLPQAQGQIFVAECDYCDRYSYHPSMPPVLTRTWRDDDQQRALRQALDAFLAMRDEILDRARRHGLFAERRRLATAIDGLAEDAAAFNRLPPGEMA